MFQFKERIRFSHFAFCHVFIVRCDFCSNSSVFLTIARLEEHEKKNIHNIREKKITLLDYAIDKFTEHVESEESARLKVATDSFMTIAIKGDDRGLTEGYALKRIKHSAIGDEAKAAVEEFFLKHRNMTPPKRACLRAFAQAMVEMKDTNGKYKFEVAQLLSEKQVQGLFSRMEKEDFRRQFAFHLNVAKKNTKGTAKTVTSKIRKRKATDQGGNTNPKKVHSEEANEHKEQVTHAEGEVEEQNKVDEEEEDEDEDEEEEDTYEFLRSALMEERENLFL